MAAPNKREVEAGEHDLRRGRGDPDPCSQWVQYEQMGYFDMESRQVIPGPVGFVVVGRLGVGAAPSRGSLGPNARLRQYIKPGNIVALPGKTVEDLRQYPEA